jgi:signal transduction histidine kinase
MKPVLNMSSILVRSFAVGAIILLVFYANLFFLAFLSTEDYFSERRMELIAPHYVKQFETNDAPIIEVNPVLTIYSDIEYLPQILRRRLNKDWLGVTNINIEENLEFSVAALEINTKQLGLNTVYAVENIEAFELEDEEIIIYQLILAAIGILSITFLAFLIMKASKRISLPFVKVSNQIKHSPANDYSTIEIEGLKSKELVALVDAINLYRSNILSAFNREQSFTRYVSHELRTPMTVIKGSLSVLRKKESTENKHIELIEHAIEEMEQLIQTFLYLAREQEALSVSTQISTAETSQWHFNFEPLLKANQVSLAFKLEHPVELNCHPVLFTALINNLLKNAINCSIDGHVEVTISKQSVLVVDNGVGLNQKSRGYEGFGIGLNIVQDICDKYGWQFSLTDNEDKGCSALVTF